MFMFLATDFRISRGHYQTSISNAFQTDQNVNRTISSSWSLPSSGILYKNCIWLSFFNTLLAVQGPVAFLTFSTRKEAEQVRQYFQGFQMDPEQEIYLKLEFAKVKQLHLFNDNILSDEHEIEVPVKGHTKQLSTSV